MATLTGKKPKNTYKDLLQVSNSNAGIDGTLRSVEDGEGTASVLQLSTSLVNINSATGLQLNGTTALSSGLLKHEVGGLEADVSAFSGLVKIAGGATSAVTLSATGEGFLDTGSTATAREYLGLAIGSDVQAWDADLDTLAGLSDITSLTELADLAVVPGDTFYVDGSSNIVRLPKGTDGQVFTLASGVPSWAAASGGDLSQLSSTGISSGASSVDFTGLSTSYSWYMILFQQIITQTDDVNLWLRIHNGTAFRSSAGDYSYAVGLTTASSTGGDVGSNSATQIVLNAATTDGRLGTNTNENMSGVIFLPRKNLPGLEWKIAGKSSTGVFSSAFGGGGFFGTNDTPSGFQLLPSSGNFASGVVTVYGIT